MTHADLVKHARSWLVKSKGCGFAFAELVTYASETPDAIGWRDGRPVLVECKASRADFLSDAKKRHREYPETGMGAFRYYMCPRELITPEELPDRWGLVWVNDNGKKRQIRGPRGNCFGPHDSPEFYFAERNERGETLMLISALRRLELQGHLEKIHISPFRLPAGNVCFNRGCPELSRRRTWCTWPNIKQIDICPGRITIEGGRQNVQ